MSDLRFQQYLARFHNARLNRRALVQRAAAAAVAVPAGAALGAHRVGAAPLAAPRRQIDAKTLVIADDLRPGANWITFDPAWIYEINAAAGHCLNYEPLYDLPDSTKPDEFTPLLAADFPEVSEDGLEVIIPLRSGVKFHSGNEMTADDVVFSWNRTKNIKYQPSFLATDYWSSVEAVDPLTIKINLVSQNAALVAILTSLPLAVTDSKLLKENGGTDAEDADQVDTAKEWFNAGNSAGTGPYRLTAWEIENQIILEKNPDYWGEPAKLDRMIWRNVVDANSQLQAVQAGEADIAYSVDPDVAGSVTEDPNLQLISGPSLAIEYLAMHTQEDPGGPLANPTLRQALGYAIDYDGIVNGLMSGAAIQPATIAPEPLPGTVEIQDKKYVTDLARAQELFDEAGGGPLELTFSYGAGDVAEGGLDLETLCTKLQADLQQIEGLTIKLNPMDSGQRLEQYRAGKLQMTIGPWTPDFPDVHAYAEPFGRTDTAAAGRVGYSNPEVDAALDAAIAESDPEARAAAYADILSTIITDAPFLVLYQPIAQRPANKNVQDVQTHSVYQLYLRNASKSA
ncbi:MAG TPA: ABC transporter substrate-binding protein [Thermomicrobiales bacterium]|nr:ABC transporter substrate-binding protein [Thermomicrobiales bacterium]